MKKRALIIAALLFSSLAALAQQANDVSIITSSTVTNIATGKAVGSSGVNGINNNYIFTPLSSDSGLCLYVFNNSGVNTASVTPTIWQCGDQSVTALAGNTKRWIQLYQAPATTIPVSSAVSFYVKSAGAARVAIDVTSSSAGATADLVLIQNGTGCGTFTPPIAPVPITSGCGLQATLQVNTASTTRLVTGVANKKIYVCAYSATLAGTGSTVFAQDGFIEGTGATCGTATANTWKFFNGQATIEIHELASPGFVFHTNVNANSLCFVDGGSTGTWFVSISYATL